MSVTVLQVVGMTCEHCVHAVRHELGALPGVEDVRVDLATGQVAVTATHPLDPEAARAAVEEAGYALAP